MATQIRRPTGDGDRSGTWYASSGSTFWPMVDEETVNDSDAISTNTVGYIYFTFSPFTIPAGSVINYLRVYFRSFLYDAINHARAAVKVNGTRYQTGTQVSGPDGGLVSHQYDFTTNPATGLAWVLADINGTGASPLQQFGLGGVDAYTYYMTSLSQIYAEVDYTPPSGPEHLKTMFGVPVANIKTISNVPVANVKTVDGL